MALIIEKFSGLDITDEMVSKAAEFFSSHYGVWGAVAAEKIGVKPGARVRMSPSKLKSFILPPEGQHICLRAQHPQTQLTVGHVFATRFLHQGCPVLWITQLCIHSAHRNRGIAKSLLNALPREVEQLVGILSSQPFSIAAVLRVFGNGIGDVENELRITGAAREVMISCPVPYVRNARLRGKLFENKDFGRLDRQKVISCADTGFWVDHQELMKALRVLEEKGIKWPLGDLPEGCEFLVLVQVRQTESN